MANYFVKSGTGGSDNGADWANAAESITGLLAAQAIAGGDTIYVHNTHSNTAYAAATSWTLPESGTGIVKILCVDGGDPTGASLSGTTVGNLTTGAIEQTANDYSISLSSPTNGALYIYGMTFQAGQGGNNVNSDLTFFSVGCGVMERCTLYINSTNVNGLLTFVGSGSPAYGVLNNCLFRHAATNNSLFQIGGGNYYFNGCSRHSSSGTTTAAILMMSGRNGNAEFSGCDFSAATNVVSVNGTVNSYRLLFNNCLIGTPVTGTVLYPLGPIEFHACGGADASGTLVLDYYMACGTGEVYDSQTVYLTTGAAQAKDDDGTLTSYSLVLDSNANTSGATPLYTPWFSAYVGATGSKTFTVKAADTESALLKDSELWLEVEYVGGAQTANSPQSQREGTFPLVSGTISRDVTAAGSNLTDSAEAWTGITETGTYSLAKTVTVDEYGWVRCRVALAKDTTNPVYVDPKIVVS